MWFSALLKFVIVTENKGGSRYANSLILCKAEDFDSAKQKVLAIGKSKETDYTNGEGERVQWRFSSVETLDMLGSEIEDGREVYSEFREISSDEKIDFDTEFRPELSKPTQTGV